MYLQVSRLVQHYGAYKALDDVSFDIAPGERLCLLGPSGCGKTTTLQAIAGFIRPTSGSIRVQGEVIDDAPCEKRNIGIMFQNYALFPHMTIFENVAFGLRMRSVGAQDIARRVGEMLELVRLSHKAAQLPAHLSGGEQQRIAFARAVVIRPRLLLLDEPFSNLDARLRLTMRNELLDLLKGFEIATLMVTHDQEEAMAVGDKIAVMRGGRVCQFGPPMAVYERPVSRFVAEFLGESNLVPPQSIGVATDGFLMVRPEAMRLCRPNAPVEEGERQLTGVVEQTLMLGHRAETTMRCGALALKIWTSPDEARGFAPGDGASAVWPARVEVHVTDAENGR